jgi:hypothetical protein
MPVRSGLARPHRTYLAVASLAVLALAGSGSAATPGTKAYFVHGRQLVGVPVAGQTPRDAVVALLAGPQPRTGMQTYVRAGTRLRSVTRSGSTATVDLSSAFAAGTPAGRNARLAQLVYTVSSVRGVRSVVVHVNGQTPAPSVFPLYDLTVPLTRGEIARPKRPLPSPPQPRLKPPTAATRKLQQRLADLSFLPAEDVDGRLGPETAFAVTAFQKWTGLTRDGVAGPATMHALAAAVRPMPIVAGTGRRPWASYFDGGIAFHEYPDVPTQAASHGCVRVPQYWSQRLYGFAPIGTPVQVLTRSL